MRVLTVSIQWVIVSTMMLIPVIASAQEPVVDRFLQSGELDAGEEELSNRIADNPDDQLAHFELGTLKFMRAIEHLGQSMYKYGSSSQLRNLPFARFPVPDNDDPQPITYQQAREILETLDRDLEAAAAELALVTDAEVKLPLHIFKFHLDWDSSGTIDEKEGLASVYAMYLGTGRQGFGNEDETDPAEDILETVVVFDNADVHWLRGYCSLLRGMVGFILAHDQEEMWHVMGHRVFAKAEVKFDFLMEEEAGGGMFDPGLIMDAIAGVHNFKWPLKDAQKMAQAREHILEMIVQSRLMWEAIQAETDDDREWIPAPSQTSAVTSFTVTNEMIETWHEFLREGERVLNGELLIPFWRGDNEKRGVNLARVFEEPREFDLVLWIHGSAAVPYLEEGELTSPDTWMQFQQVFQGNFVGFAIWVN